MRVMLSYLLLCWTSAIGSVQAQNLDSQTQLYIQQGTAKYQAKELSSTGFIINQESGRLPFYEIGVRQALSDSYFIDAAYQHASNDIQYAGYTQIGIPIKTKTHLQWQQAAIRVGRSHAISGADRIEWKIGLGQRRLDRDIKPTLGSLPLREVLTVAQLQLNVRWQKQVSAASQWHIGFQLQPVLRQSLQVDSFGIFDPITLRPAKQMTDHRIYTGFSYDVTPNWKLQLNAGFDTMRPQASSQEIWRKNGIPSATVRYPGSQQRLLDLSAQLTAVF